MRPREATRSTARGPRGRSALLSRRSHRSRPARAAGPDAGALHSRSAARRRACGAKHLVTCPALAAGPCPLVAGPRPRRRTVPSSRTSAARHTRVPREHLPPGFLDRAVRAVRRGTSKRGCEPAGSVRCGRPLGTRMAWRDVATAQLPYGAIASRPSGSARHALHAPDHRETGLTPPPRSPSPH